MLHILSLGGIYLKKNKGDLIFGISLTVITILILGSFFVFKDKLAKDDDGSTFTTDTVYDLDISNEPMLGDPDAPVTIVEFGDYKCPACGFFANNILPAIDAEYIQTGKVNFVFKNFPFIFEDSTRAAIYTEGVFNKLGNDAFWKINKSIFAYQNEIYPNNDLTNEHKDMYTEDYLEKTSKELFGNEDAKKLSKILSDDKHKDEVNNDLDEAKDAQVQGTPTVFVNGQKVYNSLNYEMIKGAIDEALNNKDSK